MSDYMFMLESHLSTDQNRVVSEMQEAALETNVSLFLTGGAMRDMLGGFAIRDLDFTVEGNSLKVARLVAQKTGAEILSEDDLRKTAELRFAGGVTAEISMARQERYPKPAGRPQVTPATIYEDLRFRDFTVNAIALSLNRASRGLLIDPTNGLADLERKELRSVHNYVFYDDPVRMLRLMRLRVRLGFTIDERTRQQFMNAREAEMETKIAPRRLFEELKRIADDPNPVDVLKVLDEEKLSHLFARELTGSKLNLAGLAKLHKARQFVPAGARFPMENLGLFLHTLTEKLTPRERAQLVEGTAMEKAEIEVWQKLEARAKKLEKELQSAKLSRPAPLFTVLSKARGEDVIFLLMHSPVRLVQDRIKNYLQKYLPIAQEVTDEEIRAQGFEPGTPKFEKAKEELIAARISARPKKVEEPEPEPTPPPVETGPKRGGFPPKPAVARAAPEPPKPVAEPAAAKPPAAPAAEKRPVKRMKGSA